MTLTPTAPPAPAPRLADPGPLLSYAYVSVPVRRFPRAELVELLNVSRRNNARIGVTGMLLYKGGVFMQALEGPEAAVRALQERIGRDPRHRSVITVLEDWTEERQFGDWMMGFRDLDDPTVRLTPGYSEFLNVALTGEEFAGQPSRARRLLVAFKLGMCRAPWPGE